MTDRPLPDFSVIHRPVEQPAIDPEPFLWDAMAMLAIAGIVVVFAMVVPS